MGRTSDAGQRLVDAMARLVHRHGYSAVGVDDVCREAGVKKGSFYYYFESKHDLMLAAIKHQWLSQLGPMMQIAFDASHPPLERFDIMFDAIADVETANCVREGHVLGCPIGKVAAESGPDQPALRGAADAAFCGGAALFQAALAEAQKGGQIGPAVNVEDAAQAIVAYLQGVMLVAKTRNDPSLIRRLGRLALRLVLEPAEPGRETPAESLRKPKPPGRKSRRAGS